MHLSGYIIRFVMEDKRLEGFPLETLPEPETKKEEETSVGRFILDILETLVLSALLFLLINAVSARIRVDGFSMEPTLLDGEFVFVSKLSYKLGEPQRGDVIVFRYPRDPEEEYIKRLIGLPGDHVRISDGQVFINNQLITEPYIAAAPYYQSEWVVPDNTYFVLGDNRNSSSDSHNWGPVPEENVIGKAIFVYWPPKEWGSISHPKILLGTELPSAVQ
jgi:signal peptidase I